MWFQPLDLERPQQANPKTWHSAILRLFSVVDKQGPHSSRRRHRPTRSTSSFPTASAFLNASRRWSRRCTVAPGIPTPPKSSASPRSAESPDNVGGRDASPAGGRAHRPGWLPFWNGPRRSACPMEFTVRTPVRAGDEGRRSPLAFGTVSGRGRGGMARRRGSGTAPESAHPARLRHGGRRPAGGSAVSCPSSTPRPRGLSRPLQDQARGSRSPRPQRRQARWKTGGTPHSQRRSRPSVRSTGLTPEDTPPCR